MAKIASGAGKRSPSKSKKSAKKSAKPRSGTPARRRTMSAAATLTASAPSLRDAVRTCVKAHFSNLPPSTVASTIYPNLSNWRAEADEIAACLKGSESYFNKKTQLQLAVAIAGMHDRSINDIITGICDLGGSA